METRKQKQTRNKQRKHDMSDMFDLAIPVDIFVQRRIVIGAHTEKIRQNNF